MEPENNLNENYLSRQALFKKKKKTTKVNDSSVVESARIRATSSISRRSCMLCAAAIMTTH